MCGIAVILPGADVEVPPFAIDRMTAALHHRGPDDQNVLRLPGCQLGHTRLSIIDPANGRQPMTDAAGRYTVVFNGEIYNHADLRAELQREGVQFHTRCDTEVVLQLYIRRGRSMLARLNGQFAFAVWDAEEHTLFAARDRFGEKPLYWARSPRGHVLLASEIKSILAAGLIAPRLDVLSADAYLGLFYVPPGRTIYENVHPLPPAHASFWRNGRREQWRYWEPTLSTEAVGEAEAVERVRSFVSAAVRRQTVADVPVGAFLSGGLDSSTIVAEMAGQASGAVRTFAVGFGDLIDELPFAREVAERYATEHHELQATIDVAAMLGRMNEVYDEPFGDSSNIPTFMVAEHARRHVKVVLSGDGGDEIFGGYSWYTPLLDENGPPDRWERHVGGSTAALADRTALWGGPRRQPATAGVIRAAHRPPESVTHMDRATHFDATCYLPGDILVKVDRAAMAHGLETRAPFLDAELSDYVLSLPWRMRFGGPQLKHLLRRACGHLWPASVRARGKQGFGAPVRHWLQQPEVAAIWDRVSGRGSALTALLPGLPAAKPELRPQRTWTLMCLGLWLERRSECLAGLS